jgi:hypothetical protein
MPQALGALAPQREPRPPGHSRGCESGQQVQESGGLRQLPVQARDSCYVFSVTALAVIGVVPPLHG